MIFSFSQLVWEDMLKGYIVMQNETKYIVIEFNKLDTLPKPTQQRSVLIKNFTANIVNKVYYTKTGWEQASLSLRHYMLIAHFIKNRNNHTTSDWNSIRNKSYARYIVQTYAQKQMFERREITCQILLKMY